VESGQLDSADVADILKECIEDLKLSTDSLESVEADLLLLLETLRFRIGPRFDDMGIALQWELKDVRRMDWLEPRVSLHILRILQEAFTNIIKRAHATEIHVAAAETADGVTLSIIDNGVGFALALARQSGGRGLQNQLRRAKAIGGRVRWTSADRGTCFLLWLPTST
jgi:signal transduction histidine kinase